MDKLKEFFSANKKGIAIGTAILFLLFGLLASSDKEKTEVPEENTVATTLDQSSEFDLSLGGLKILIPKEKLYEVKGNEKKIENFPDSNYPFYIYDNMSVAVDKDMVLGIIAYADKPEVKTEKNIHSGSTVEEFLTAYGRECIFHEGGDVDGDGSDTFQYVFKSKGGNNFALLTFHVLDEKVKNIELGLIGEDIYNEMAKEVTTYADTVRKGEFPISIAGIKLGSTAKDLDNSQSYFSDKNFEEKVNDDGTVRRKYTDLIVTFENGVIQGLVTHTDKLATGEKIRKGSNVEEVLNAYGDSCSVSKYNGLTLLEYVYDSPKNRTAVLRFAMNGNIVDYISLRIVTADERKNLLSVNKNLRQELEQEKQRQAEAQRQAELQRQQEQERQRQSLGTTVEKFIQNYNDILYIMGQAQEKNLSHLRITGFDKGYDGFKLYMSNCSAYVCGARANGSNLQTIYFLSNDTASMVGQTNFVHVSLAGAYALTYALNNNKSKALYDRLINIFDQRKFPTEFLHEGGLVAGFTNDGSGSAVMFMTEEFYREGYNKFNR